MHILTWVSTVVSPCSRGRPRNFNSKRGQNGATGSAPFLAPAPAPFYGPGPGGVLAPEKHFGPGPAGAMAPEKYFGPGPGGAMAPKKYFGPGPGGAGRGFGPAGAKRGLPGPGKTLHWIVHHVCPLILRILRLKTGEGGLVCPPK